MLDVRLNIRRLEDFVVEIESRPVEKGKIIFYGDSSFTRWQPKYGNVNLHDVILGSDGSKACLNHGIGGSTAEELLYYYPRLIRAYEPRAIVLQAFCNDRDVSYNASEVVYLQARLLEYARQDFHGIKLYVCDVRPLSMFVGELCWLALGSALREYNELIGDYCKKHDDCILIRHAADPVFFEEGFAGDYDHPRKDIFIDDRVHYNSAGYELYANFFRRQLKDIL